MKEITCVHESYNKSGVKAVTWVFWSDDTLTTYYGKHAEKQPKIEEFKQLLKDIVVRGELENGGYTLTYDVMKFKKKY